MTTQQRMVAALNQADQPCKSGHCVLAPAIDSVGKALEAAVDCYASHSENPVFDSFEYGLHVGYRLAQLEIEDNEHAQEN